MYGLEKKTKPLFEFDLEKELKQDPEKVKILIQNAESKIEEIKSQLRSGNKGQSLDDLGILLQGYVALKKILNKFSK